MNLSGITYQTSRLYLAKEVLAEIPDQFLGFMKTRNVTPQKLAKKLTNQLSNLPPDPELLTQSGFYFCWYFFSVNGIVSDMSIAVYCVVRDTSLSLPKVL